MMVSMFRISKNKNFNRTHVEDQLALRKTVNTRVPLRHTRTIQKILVYIYTLQPSLTSINVIVIAGNCLI